MLKRAAPLLILCLVAATAVQAQSGGGRGRGGGRGSPTGAPSGQPGRPAKAFAEPEIVGVVKAIDLAGGRVTITYESNEALNWPEGTQPFIVVKSALLKDLTVGEKVRFKLESQQISTIRPF